MRVIETAHPTTSFWIALEVKEMDYQRQLSWTLIAEGKSNLAVEG